MRDEMERRSITLVWASPARRSIALVWAETRKQLASEKPSPPPPPLVFCSAILPTLLLPIDETRPVFYFSLIAFLSNSCMLSKWNHTHIFSDFGNAVTECSDDMNQDAVSGRQSKASSLLKSKASLPRSRRPCKAEKSLPEDLFDELEDEPLDLLDCVKTRSVLRSCSQHKRKQDADDEPEFDSDGRMLIHEGVKQKIAPSDPDSDARSEAPSQILASSSRSIRKRRRISQDGWAYTGSEYGNRKAGGDVKKKDKLEPYAFWPLDRKMVSRRPEHRASARRCMASVVKMAKKLEGKSASSALSTKFMTFKKSQKKHRKGKAR